MNFEIYIHFDDFEKLTNDKSGVFLQPVSSWSLLDDIAVETQPY